MHEALPFEPEMVHIKGGKFQMGISKAEAEKISRLSGLHGSD
jgi:formylglycine-generating enzyme required for sulfatase activity